jgi:hypothetical protein
MHGAQPPTSLKPTIALTTPNQCEERAEAARDAAVYDLSRVHSLLSELGVPAHLGARPATLTERMRMMLAAIHVGNTERHIMVAVSRAGAS